MAKRLEKDDEEWVNEYSDETIIDKKNAQSKRQK
jgi:hypothetical protein